MKLFKKVLSVFLAAVMMVTALPLTASAANSKCTSDYTISGYESDNYYCIEIGGISKADYNAAKKRKNMCICAYFEIDGVTHMFMDVSDSLISLTAFTKLSDEVNVGVSGTYSEKATDGYYSFTFKLPKNNSTAKSYVKKIAKLSTGAVTFGCFESDFSTIVSPYGGDPLILTVRNNFDFPSLSGSSKKTKISSLDFAEISSKYTYTGKARKPAVKIFDDDYKLVKGTDYTVSYKNNKEIGTATITVKGKGNYTGTKTITFKIVPKKTTLKVTKSSDTKAKFSWTAVDGAEKYQIYYSENGGKYKKLATVSGEKTSYTSSKLDFKNNTYKFKIRSYGVKDDTKYYSSYSSVVTAK
ncbi:MAG: fibronectin type III domain-containing protein [Ruminiclostridium sp.]|nr:fibronectin type III domain-containing protein [Ruminiclostridium sp.]MBQ8841942.1 fibronectin type III domain-containing protein [Ruminiclostridium sp.]